MECVAYMRVSTEKQAEEGNGLDSQKRDIENYARKNELIISDWYVDDGYTGANMNRPQLQRLINDCARHRVRCVVAFKLDRISRSMVDGIYMIERVFQPNNVEFKCVHDNVGYDDPMQQAYTQMMAVFAQLDKNTMLLRMRGGMLERVKQGYWRGGGNLPYCYSYDKEQGILIPIPERAEQAQEAMRLWLEGYSDEKIQHILGYEWERTVHQILTSPVNVGMIPYKGQLYQGLHEPIFDKETFELAQQQRKIRKRARAYCRTEPSMLTGLCYCGVCGCKMRYQKWFDGNDRIYCYSRNHSVSDKLPNWTEGCNNAIHIAKDIEQAVENKILEISLNLSQATIPKQESKYDVVMNRLDKEKTKLKRLYNLYAEGNDTAIELIKEQEQLIKSMESEAKKIYDEEASTPTRDLVYDNIKKIADIWGHINDSDRNKILKIIISKVVITNGNVDIHLNF